MSPGRLLIVAILCCSTAPGCSRPRRGDFRGVTAPSPDGETYLVVGAGEGPPCAPVVDGEPWPHPPGVPGRVAPGPHAVGCPGDEHPSAIVIHQGATFRFQAWGP